MHVSVITYKDWIWEVVIPEKLLFFIIMAIFTVCYCDVLYCLKIYSIKKKKKMIEHNFQWTLTQLFEFFLMLIYLFGI